jgi:hypothetical protein
MSESATIDKAIESAEVKIVKIWCGEFNGAFKNFANACYNDLKFYGLPKEVAHKVASDFMSSLGDAMSQDSDLSAKVSKAKKEGESRFNLSGKSGYVKQSYAMSIARIAQELDKIRVEKLFCKPVSMEFLVKNGFLSKELMAYLEKSEQWAAAQTWKD